MVQNQSIRKILHVDMDAFYASIEQRDFPELRGKPIIVGGRPDSRGVVATCSYEAREFGIHSAMASSHAHRLCPQAVFVPPRFHVYRSVSQQIGTIFHQYSDLVEPLSLDEAFMDVTENKFNIPSATIIAKEIKEKIFRETQLTASAGVSINKFLAKVASDFNKPDGLTVIPPRQAVDFIAKLPVTKFFGVGRVTAEKMHRLGIRVGEDLRNYSLNRLTEIFGKSGEFFYQISRGIDLRPVETARIRKSLGKEVTLEKDIEEMPVILGILQELAEQVEHSMKKHEIKGKTVTLKVKYHDFRSITRSVTVDKPIATTQMIMPLIRDLLGKTDAGRTKIRLLGMSLSNLVSQDDDSRKGQYFQPEFDFEFL